MFSYCGFRWSFWVILGVAVALVGGSCGYRVASKNRIDQKRSIAVQTLENETTTPEIEQLFSRALVQELVRSTNFSVQNRPDSAEVVLQGKIIQVLVSPIGFEADAFASTFLISVSADITVRDRGTDKILFRHSNYTFRDQYVINVDVENFFSESNPALERISRDFASSLVATFVEDF